ncbi:Prolyl 4-hydroxylase alpha subunit [Penicillium paradoxum]|uniref:Prolyl 4-hydroxylase alpha subunit n=1 Tax=Penicillium paradoxum TaxID=176176 RepID=UPI0025473057|nr:Prolyl 4-hydroxylase alpha subunit [Penicillium paradoxum]KAJ5774019.1 Prolyl 4-hydroxylase alpha subunit [Penicillium paradoxum]
MAVYLHSGPASARLLPEPGGRSPESNRLDDFGAPGPGINLTDDSFISPEDGVPFNCPGAEQYRVHLLLREPLVMYIENFVSEAEANHILDISVNKYSPSIVYDGQIERVDPTKRLSDRALLDRDNTVRCLEDRARAFQGWRPNLYIERMWAQRYNASGHYRHHYDWAGSLARGGDRFSTFMVYLDADCEGGGTNFPRLKMPAGEDWCRFLECDQRGENGQKQEMGITFKPIKGNAVFWENLRADGTGYLETWHAAFPVTKGTKVGLNIWSWYQPGKQRNRSGM